MKYFAIIFVWLLILFCERTYSQGLNAAEKFYKSIGEEKTLVFEKTIKSFDVFLFQNFRFSRNQHNRIVKFLKYLSKNEFEQNINWKFDKDINKQIINDFESSGIRKDIWLYNCELSKIDSSFISFYMNYRDSIENLDIKKEIDTVNYFDYLIIEEEIVSNQTIDSIIYKSNVKSKYQGDSIKIASSYSCIAIKMKEIYPKDYILEEYINAKFMSGSITPSILIDGLLNVHKNYNFDEPLVKIIIILEIYYNYIYSNTE